MDVFVCLANKEPCFKDWDGAGDPVAFVLSLNARRRHLSESQRALAAAKLASLDKGQHPYHRGVHSAQVLASKGPADRSIDLSQFETSLPVTIPGAAELLNIGTVGSLELHQLYEVLSYEPELSFELRQELDRAIQEREGA